MPRAFPADDHYYWTYMMASLSGTIYIGMTNNWKAGRALRSLPWSNRWNPRWERSRERLGAGKCSCRTKVLSSTAAQDAKDPGRDAQAAFVTRRFSGSFACCGGLRMTLILENRQTMSFRVRSNNARP